MAKTNGAIKPDHKEIAQMVVLSRLGLSAVAIGKRMSRSNHTVAKYIQSAVAESPEVQVLIDLITQKEIEDLRLLGAKARNRLHELIDEGKTKMIETCAVMDRSFQQIRLLEGNSTANLDIMHQNYLELKNIREQAMNLVKKLRNVPENEE
tara:strand:+ start:2277 stop:2729 length:453 start_codon:yes stop_codon:yes gene_type:complete